MKGWYKIEEGWYTNSDNVLVEGDVVQRWDSVCGSPGKKLGWYAWPHENKEEDFLGPFKTMKEAINAIQK